ncbi:cell division protein and lipid II flippase FtsW [Pontimonas salivibrio]|uniref:Probable peptidoglycan glycosyltransferase FtsW n=1 Tax=Pontimonas salivibrio TaxID=1159327 RepID=A0A2L2BQM1_9MICO|nr:putative peptidoglycan glycosyltransferase FtsW [Pontimonas salivibrio]AVG23948.1 cell division protein and lipid II flippase FtsW [Pontimonas salivibrio]
MASAADTVTGTRSPSASPRALVSVRRLFRAETPQFVVMVAMVLFLVLFGLVMVLSSSFVTAQTGGQGFLGVFTRQVIWAMLGLPLMFILSTWRPQALRALAPTLLLIGLILQGLVVFTPLGITSGGNTNWLSIGGLQGQPSEFLKLALIVWMAHILADRVDYIRSPQALRRPLIQGVVLALSFVLFGQDLGTMGVMALIVLGVFFVAGVRLSLLGAVVGATAGVAGVMALFAPYRLERVTVWLSGCTEDEFLYQCWQPMQGTMALGSGGVLGVGLGNSRAKWSWLPEADTDYIFAVIGEELGLVGASLVIISFTVLAIAMVRLVQRSPDPFARLVTAGVMIWIVGQALVNIAVVLEYLPVLGVPLPFISVGGSALLSTLLGIGVVMAVNRNSRVTPVWQPGGSMEAPAR